MEIMSQSHFDARVILFFPHSIGFRWGEDGFEKKFNDANIRCIQPEYNWVDTYDEAKKYAKKVFDGKFTAIIYPDQASEILRHPRVVNYWALEGKTEKVNIYTIVEILKKMNAPLFPCGMSFHHKFDDEATLLINPDELVRQIGLLPVPLTPT